MVSKSDIEEFVAEANRAIETDPQMNEAMTRHAILDSFCDLLGWEFPQPGEVEFPVEAFGQQYRVDYAYVRNGKEKAFIEAKGLDTPLTDDTRNQLKAYLKNGTAKLGILSNGQQYEFYRRVTNPELKVKQATVLQLEQLADNPRVLREFTHERLSDSSDDDVIEIIQENELYNILRTDKAEIAADIEQTIADHTEDDIAGDEFHTSIRSKVETAAKSAVDTIISQIERSNGNENVGSEEQGYIIKLQNEGETLDTFSDDVQSDVMAEAVSYLIENYDLISEIEPLPYIPGKEKAIINDEPSSPHDEEAMRMYRELTEGYYLDTHMGAPNKKRHLRRLAEKCRVDVMFIGEW